MAPEDWHEAGLVTQAEDSPPASPVERRSCLKKRVAIAAPMSTREERDELAAFGKRLNKRLKSAVAPQDVEEPTPTAPTTPAPAVAVVDLVTPIAAPTMPSVPVAIVDLTTPAAAPEQEHGTGCTCLFCGAMAAGMNRQGEIVPIRRPVIFGDEPVVERAPAPQPVKTKADKPPALAWWKDASFKPSGSVAKAVNNTKKAPLNLSTKKERPSKAQARKRLVHPEASEWEDEQDDNSYEEDGWIEKVDEVKAKVFNKAVKAKSPAAKFVKEEAEVAKPGLMDPNPSDSSSCTSSHSSSYSSSHCFESSGEQKQAHPSRSDIVKFEQLIKEQKEKEAKKKKEREERKKEREQEKEKGWKI